MQHKSNAGTDHEEIMPCFPLRKITARIVPRCDIFAPSGDLGFRIHLILDVSAILLWTVDRAPFLCIFVREVGLSGASSSITFLHIRISFQMFKNIISFSFFIFIY